MAWIRADITNKFAHLDVENVMQIESILKRQLYDKEATANINLDFDEVYNNSIYTSYESILGLLKFIAFSSQVMQAMDIEHQHGQLQKSLPKKQKKMSLSWIFYLCFLQQ